MFHVKQSFATLGTSRKKLNLVIYFSYYFIKCLTNFLCFPPSPFKISFLKSYVNSKTSVNFYGNKPFNFFRFFIAFHIINDIMLVTSESIDLSILSGFKYIKKVT